MVVAVKPAAGPAWNCAFCSASNVFSATKCFSCKQEKFGSAPPAPAPMSRAHSAPSVGGSEAWTCAYCKIINLTATAQCAGCHQPKCTEDATSSPSSSSSVSSEFLVNTHDMDHNHHQLLNLFHSVLWFLMFTSIDSYHMPSCQPNVLYDVAVFACYFHRCEK